MGLDLFPGAVESLVLFAQSEPPVVLRFPNYVVWAPLVVGLLLLTPIFMSGKQQPGRKWTLVVVGWLFALPALFLATPMLWTDELTLQGYKLHQTGFLGPVRPERDYDFSRVRVIQTSSSNGSSLGSLWKVEYDSGQMEDVVLSDLWSYHRETIRKHLEDHGVQFR